MKAMEIFDGKYSRDQRNVAFERLRRFCIEHDIDFKYKSLNEFIDDYDTDVGDTSSYNLLKDIYIKSLEKIKPYIPNPDKCIWHPLDIEYFETYNAPVMENLHRLHYTNVNSTITFFGPMLYFFVRALGCEHVLEIGMAEGYTSFYLANAVKDNGTRYNMKGNMYYGLEILNKANDIEEKLDNLNIPNDIRVMDSMNLTSETFKDTIFDLIFQDGSHETKNVLYELETLYPQLKGNGQGYWVAHDIDGPAEEAFKIIYKQIADGKYNFQYVGIGEIYGLGIFRKMDGYDYEKNRWVK